jgi:hypothetical protein
MTLEAASFQIFLLMRLSYVPYFTWLTMVPMLESDHAVDVAHSMLSCAEAHPYVIGARQSYEYSIDFSRILTNYDSG